MFEVLFTIASIFQTYIFYLLMSCFYRNVDTSSKKVLLGCAIFFFITTPAYLLFSIPVVNILSIVVCSIVMNRIIYGGKISKCILVTVLSVVLMMISEAIVAVCIGATQTNVIERSGYYTSLFTALLLPIIQYLLVLLIRNFSSLKYDETMPKAYWIIALSLPLATSIFLVIMYTSAKLSIILMTLSGILLLAINFMVIYLYDNTIRNMQARRENEILEMQNRCQQKEAEAMQQMMEQIRKERHDFYKHLSSMNQRIVDKRYEEVKQYIDDLLDETDKLTEYTQVDTGNYTIDSILNYEIQRAKREKICINNDCVIPKELKLSPKDMNVVLMNLLDNAIEAVRNEEKKEIQCSIQYQNSQLLIRISNPCSKPTGTIGKTSKKNTIEHGYGLKNVKKVVEQYFGLMVVEAKEGQFMVKIVLNL